MCVNRLFFKRTIRFYCFFFITLEYKSNDYSDKNRVRFKQDPYTKKDTGLYLRKYTQYHSSIFKTTILSLQRS